MHTIFQPLKTVFSHQTIPTHIQHKFRLFSPHALNQCHPHFILHSSVQSKQLVDSSKNDKGSVDFAVSKKHPDDSSITRDATKVQNVLKLHCSAHKLNSALGQCGLLLSEELVLQVLKRHRSDWKPAFLFFNWVSKRRGDNGFVLGSEVYNEILDILGRMKRFEELDKVFDEMSKRKGVVNERTFAVLIHRYASAHMIEKATEVFCKRKLFGFELDLTAFQTLLLSLCRYKHVEAAEVLFRSKMNEYPLHIKTLNIILNGWCVLGSLREAKRFWNDIICSSCKPDLFTYGIMINSLTKNGKLGSALELFRSMWKKGITPDVAICNCIIDALCFKKRIPEALDIFQEMNDKGCPPNAATYNSLIKYLCKNRRMDKVYELLDEMEQKKGCCLPNVVTFNFLLKSMKKPDEVPELLERMQRNGCEITGDAYNLILKLFMDWNDDQGIQSIWVEMEKTGIGHDRRSYTIMIHGLHSNGKMEEALCYFTEMVSKGLLPEPRTNFLVCDIKTKLRGKKELDKIVTGEQCSFIK